ncbi:hypothetical protein B0T11DRAFT_288927 [Plectosphaerella cucumerina]|uniref:Secreted protein n=1 Tax=Plectosphaerella cucumerina TaxID=40658 RepID=A0A8K0X062_9PEZI|nr:hypothetical protein B0T11DRAFT_288927 [Plectosphaerella cucumerina]
MRPLSLSLLLTLRGVSRQRCWSPACLPKFPQPPFTCPDCHEPPSPPPLRRPSSRLTTFIGPAHVLPRMQAASQPCPSEPVPPSLPHDRESPSRFTCDGRRAPSNLSQQSVPLSHARPAGNTPTRVLTSACQSKPFRHELQLGSRLAGCGSSHLLDDADPSSITRSHRRPA